MNNLKLTLGIEPTDKYEKTKAELIQALKSIRELPPKQRELLAKDVFGAANVAAVLSFISKP